MTEPLDKSILAALAADLVDIDDMSPRLKMMLYGPSGAGKTVTAAAFAKQLNRASGKETLYIDTSDGARAIRNHAPLREGIKVIPYRGIAIIQQIAKAVAAKQKPFDNIGVIILDEASTMATRHTMVIQKKRYGDMPEDEFPVPDWPDFRKLANHMRGMMQFMHEDANLHIMLLAHEKQIVKDNVLVKEAIPKFTPLVYDEMKGDMDLVARQTAKRTKIPGSKDWEYLREVQAWPDAKIEAKSRVPLDFKVGLEDFIGETMSWLSGGAPNVGIDMPAAREDNTTNNTADDEEGLIDD